MTSSNTFFLGGDLPINRLGYGAMRLAANGFTGPARDPQTGLEVLRQALAAGVNHIDTADFYISDDGALSANALIREALHPYPDDLVIATKVGPRRTAGGGVEMTTDPDALRPMVEANLEALGLERLDLVYLRLGAPDESATARFEALSAMRDEGLIRHLGLSNAETTHLHQARAIAPVAAVQNHFAATQREDLDMLAACEEAGIAFVPFFPLGGGFSDITDDRLTTIAARHDATPAQIALAWLLARSPVTIAIPGTGSPAHLAENMAAASVTLTPEDLAQLA